MRSSVFYRLLINSLICSTMRCLGVVILEMFFCLFPTPGDRLTLPLQCRRQPLAQTPIARCSHPTRFWIKALKHVATVAFSA